MARSKGCERGQIQPRIQAEGTYATGVLGLDSQAMHGTKGRLCGDEGRQQGESLAADPALNLYRNKRGLRFVQEVVGGSEQGDDVVGVSQHGTMSLRMISETRTIPNQRERD